MTSAIMVADTSVLVNFLRIDRMDLLACLTRKILVTDHVEAEMAEAYPEKKARYIAALSVSQITVCTVNDPQELELFARLGPGVRLGAGECSAIAVATNRQHALAIDDHRAVKLARREVCMDIDILKTMDLMIELIKSGKIELEEADSIKNDWAHNHRFRLKIDSFRDLL